MHDSIKEVVEALKRCRERVEIFQANRQAMDLLIAQSRFATMADVLMELVEIHLDTCECCQKKPTPSEGQS